MWYCVPIKAPSVATKVINNFIYTFKNQTNFLCVLGLFFLIMYILKYILFYCKLCSFHLPFILLLEHGAASSLIMCISWL